MILMQRAEELDPPTLNEDPLRRGNLSLESVRNGPKLIVLDLDRCSAQLADLS